MRDLRRHRRAKKARHSRGAESKGAAPCSAAGATLDDSLCASVADLAQSAAEAWRGSTTSLSGVGRSSRFFDVSGRAGAAGLVGRLPRGLLLFVYILVHLRFGLFARRCLLLWPRVLLRHCRETNCACSNNNDRENRRSHGVSSGGLHRSDNAANSKRVSRSRSFFENGLRTVGYTQVVL